MSIYLFLDASYSLSLMSLVKVGRDSSAAKNDDGHSSQGGF